jgi:hypothetical protein
MCWNAEVSLYTFINTLMILVLLYLLNYNKFALACILSFIFIQLLEYFIWTYINKPKISRIFGFLTFLIIFLQPIILMYISKFWNMLCLYILIQLIILIIFCLFSKLEINCLPTVAKNGHLLWNWNIIKNKSYNYMYTFLFSIVYLTFFLGTMFIGKYYDIFIISILTLIYSIYNYSKNNTISTMWCWIANVVVIYGIFDALIINIKIKR